MRSNSQLWLGLLLGGATLGILGVWRQVSSSEPARERPSQATSAAPGQELDAKRPFHGRLGVDRDGQPDEEQRTAGETRRPHPITPLHEAMAERRQLIGALRSALEEQQYDRVRSLLDEAAELELPTPEDSAFGDALRGYRLILDCLAARGEAIEPPHELPRELLERSRRYVDEQRLPPRREVRRVCLEGRPFTRKS